MYSFSNILIFKDYQNAVIFNNSNDNCDAYDDENFWDIVNEHCNKMYEENWENYKTEEFLTRLFQSECIDEIIQDYIRCGFNNDTLWFDIAVEPKTLTATFFAQQADI